MGNQGGFPGGRMPPTEEEKKRQRERRREDGRFSLFFTFHLNILFTQNDCISLGQNL